MNTIGWGNYYCVSWWGDVSNTATVDIDSQPECFANYINSI